MLSTTVPQPVTPCHQRVNRRPGGSDVCVPHRLGQDKTAEPAAWTQGGATL